MRKLLGALMIAGVAGTGVWAAAADDRWIHIRVDDHDDGHGRVDIQLPLGMVSSLLPAIKADGHGGGIHVRHGDVDVQDIRAYWTAVRDAKDGEYVTVKDDDAHVRIAKSAGYLLVNVDETAGGARVRVKVPVALVDAVLATSDAESVDLQAVARALEKAPSGELISVEDDDSHVRIWIDAQPAPARGNVP